MTLAHFTYLLCWPLSCYVHVKPTYCYRLTTQPFTRETIYGEKVELWGAIFLLKEFCWFLPFEIPSLWTCLSLKTTLNSVIFNSTLSGSKPQRSSLAHHWTFLNNLCNEYPSYVTFYLSECQEKGYCFLLCHMWHLPNDFFSLCSF